MLRSSVSALAQEQFKMEVIPEVFGSEYQKILLEHEQRRQKTYAAMTDLLKSFEA